MWIWRDGLRTQEPGGLPMVFLWNVTYVNEYLFDGWVDLPSEANMRVRSIAMFSNVEVDSARDGRR